MDAFLSHVQYPQWWLNVVIALGVIACVLIRNLKTVRQGLAVWGGHDWFCLCYALLSIGVVFLLVYDVRRVSDGPSIHELSPIIGRFVIGYVLWRVWGNELSQRDAYYASKNSPRPPDPLGE